MNRWLVFPLALALMACTAHAQAAETSPGAEVFSQVGVDVVHQAMLVRNPSATSARPEAVFLAKVTNGSKFAVASITGRLEARERDGQVLAYLEFSYVAPKGQSLRPGATIVPSRGFAIGDLPQPRTASLKRVFDTPLAQLQFGFIPDTITFASGDAIQLVPIAPTIPTPYRHKETTR